MRTWKATFAYLVVGYLLFAGSVSLAVQHYAERGIAKLALTTAASPPAFAGNPSFGLDPRGWDFTGPDDTHGSQAVLPSLLDNDFAPRLLQ